MNAFKYNSPKSQLLHTIFKEKSNTDYGCLKQRKQFLPAIQSKLGHKYVSKRVTLISQLRIIMLSPI